MAAQPTTDPGPRTAPTFSPDIALRQIRSTAAKLSATDADTRRRTVDRLHWADVLADAVSDLDNWLSRGGMPPAAWAYRPQPTEQEIVPYMGDHEHGSLGHVVPQNRCEE
jgi:hypothetical protein